MPHFEIVDNDEDSLGDDPTEAPIGFFGDPEIEDKYDPIRLMDVAFVAMDAHYAFDRCNGGKSNRYPDRNVRCHFDSLNLSLMSTPLMSGRRGDDMDVSELIGGVAASIIPFPGPSQPQNGGTTGPSNRVSLLPAPTHPTPTSHTPSQPGTRPTKISQLSQLEGTGSQGLGMEDDDLLLSLPPLPPLGGSTVSHHKSALLGLGTGESIIPAPSVSSSQPTSPTQQMSQMSQNVPKMCQKQGSQSPDNSFPLAPIYSLSHSIDAIPLPNSNPTPPPTPPATPNCTSKSSKSHHNFRPTDASSLSFKLPSSMASIESIAEGDDNHTHTNTNDEAGGSNVGGSGNRRPSRGILPNLIKRLSRGRPSRSDLNRNSIITNLQGLMRSEGTGMPLGSVRSDNDSESETSGGADMTPVSEDGSLISNLQAPSNQNHHDLRGDRRVPETLDLRGFVEMDGHYSDYLDVDSRFHFADEIWVEEAKALLVSKKCIYTSLGCLNNPKSLSDHRNAFAYHYHSRSIPPVLSPPNPKRVCKLFGKGGVHPRVQIVNGELEVTEYRLSDLDNMEMVEIMTKTRSKQRFPIPIMASGQLSSSSSDSQYAYRHLQHHHQRRRRQSREGEAEELSSGQETIDRLVVCKLHALGIAEEERILKNRLNRKSRKARKRDRSLTPPIRLIPTTPNNPKHPPKMSKKKV